jgi:hypothetical protein
MAVWVTLFIFPYQRKQKKEFLAGFHGVSSDVILLVPKLRLVWILTYKTDVVFVVIGVYVNAQVK